MRTTPDRARSSATAAHLELSELIGRVHACDRPNAVVVEPAGYNILGRNTGPHDFGVNGDRVAYQLPKGVKLVGIQLIKPVGLWSYALGGLGLTHFNTGDAATFRMHTNVFDVTDGRTSVARRGHPATRVLATDYWRQGLLWGKPAEPRLAVAFPTVDLGPRELREAAIVDRLARDRCQDGEIHPVSSLSPDEAGVALDGMRELVEFIESGTEIGRQTVADSRRMATFQMYSPAQP